ncbi:MAG: precorrin-6A reductase [Oscillospiraceae bacterium]
MNKLLIFAGTTEGRELVGLADSLGFDTVVCVATEYGRELIDRDQTSAEVLEGRLNEAEMRALMLREKFDLCIDATHPYAIEVTQNIKGAANETNTRYVRLAREKSSDNGCITVSSAREAAQYLDTVSGNILLTTGSKELDIYTSVRGYDERIFPRVLASVESIERCVSLGYRQSHIIAMQGPFTCQLNEALIHRFDIKVLVTKDGGAAGGFAEKESAAEKCGIKLVLIARPRDERGMSFGEVSEMLKENKF